MKPSELIKQYGWIQKESGNLESGFCIAGAVEYTYKESIKFIIFDLLNKKIQEHESTRHLFLAEWNDQPGRTKEEVIALLESVDQ